MPAAAHELGGERRWQPQSSSAPRLPARKRRVGIDGCDQVRGINLLPLAARRVAAGTARVGGRPGWRQPLASTASCAPCHKLRPLHTTSMWRASWTGTSRFMANKATLRPTRGAPAEATCDQFQACSHGRAEGASQAGIMRTRLRRVASRLMPSREARPTRKPSSAAATRRSAAVLLGIAQAHRWHMARTHTQPQHLPRARARALAPHVGLGRGPVNQPRARRRELLGFRHDWARWPHRRWHGQRLLRGAIVPLLRRRGRWVPKAVDPLREGVVSLLMGRGRPHNIRKWADLRMALLCPLAEAKHELINVRGRVKLYQIMSC